uniref:Putative secreted protein n=1 Tax=Anopheles darlingi TaxID=43151 RepID=A0A2M4DJP6_ANODA
MLSLSLTSWCALVAPPVCGRTRLGELESNPSRKIANQNREMISSCTYKKRSNTQSGERKGKGSDPLSKT